MSDIQQAKEWAESRANGSYILSEETRAAVKVIQSLPDQWIDAEKVAELADDMSHWKLPDGPSDAMTSYRYLVEIMDGFTGRINELITPPLPTLAELIEQGNDPQQYQWMQAEHIEHGRVIITHPSSTYIYYMKMSGLSGGASHSGADCITPLPDLPRLKWPAQEPRNPEAPPAETLYTPSSDTPRNPRPEDVPAGEPWIVQHEDREWIGCRNDPGTRLPWLVIGRDYHDFDYCYDVDITLVSRLVPESPNKVR